MCKSPHSPLSGLSGHTHASSQAKENLAPAEQSGLVSRDGHSPSPAWPGGEQFSLKCSLAGSGVPARRLPCRFVPQHVILLGNLSTEDQEELGDENDPCLFRGLSLSAKGFQPPSVL